MADWPSELTITRDGFKETPPNNTQRTSMDTGPDKLRRRSSAAIRPVSFNLFVNSATVQILDDFYTTTTASGSVKFNFIHPRTGLTVSARFVSPPEYDINNGDTWTIPIALEILP